MEAKYRIKINQPTIAVFLENGRHVARTVPIGAIINADTLDGNELIEAVRTTNRFLSITPSFLAEQDLAVIAFGVVIDLTNRLPFRIETGVT